MLREEMTELSSLSISLGSSYSSSYDSREDVNSVKRGGATTAAPRRGRVTALLAGPLPWAEGIPFPISLQKAKGAGLPYGQTKGPQAPYAYERQRAPYRGLSLHLVGYPTRDPKRPSCGPLRGAELSRSRLLQGKRCCRDYWLPTGRPLRLLRTSCH